jgi:hypothetical protein
MSIERIFLVGADEGYHTDVLRELESIRLWLLRVPTLATSVSNLCVDLLNRGSPCFPCFCFVLYVCEVGLGSCGISVVLSIGLLEIFERQLMSGGGVHLLFLFICVIVLGHARFNALFPVLSRVCM